MNWPLIELGELMPGRGTSVDPSKFPDEEFALFSVPAYDCQIPDRVLGKAIGSSKQVVQPDDVLLSKIVPHIRRAWIVPESDERRQIGSSEWIIFRSPKFYGPFLRHVLLSDQFNSKLMQTVSGVGGSLLRARPTGVARIKIKLPPLEEQERIAAILDITEELRTKRRAAIALLDQLPQAIFLEMFGDPASNPKDWSWTSLAEVIADGPQNGLYKPATEYGEGTPILRIDGFYSGRVTDLSALKRVRLSKQEQDLYGLRRDDVVINRVNSREYLGKSALIPVLVEPTVFESNMMRFSLKAEVLPVYAVQVLQSPFIKSQILRACKDAVNQSSINQQDVKAFKFPLPPIDLQHKFAARVEAIQRTKTAHQSALSELDTLFASLQSSLFERSMATMQRSR